MNKYYTLIGSRETPPEIQELMVATARKLAKQGWVGRSGGADAADKCLEIGCKDLPHLMEVFLPWNGFNKCYANREGYIDTPKLPSYTTAQRLAEELHPNWTACSRGAKALHTRNCMQILGKDMKSPSRFVLCWGIPTDDKGNVKGGTGQACRLAIKKDVEILNLYHEDVQKRLRKWLNL